MRPFRFGVNVWGADTRAAWTEKARRIEQLGYSTLTVPDHLADFFAPMPAVVSAAAATTRLRVGTNVLNNDFRHPVMVAREAATADVLTDGRFQLGLGAGYMKAEYDQAGLAFDVGGTRVERLAEAVTVIKALLAGEPVDYTGRHYRVRAHRIHPRPVQRPRPPILIGGYVDAVLARGGTEPDMSAWRTAEVDRQVRLVREAAGARHDALELNALVQRVIVTDDRRRAAAELAAEWKARTAALTAEELLEAPYALIGTVDQLVEDLQRRRERWGLSYYVVFERFAEAFAPVVARLDDR